MPWHAGWRRIVASFRRPVIIPSSSKPLMGKRLSFMKPRAVFLAFALFLLLPKSVAAAECEFVLGFATLRDLIGHEIVGECLEDQRYAANGNSEQQTTGGLLVWRKADNWTAFTDGYRTWINGPNGLEQRLNTELLPWEVVKHPAVAAALASLRRSDPQAAAAIEALPWVQDGIRSLSPLNRGYQFELNRVSDLIDWARRSPQTFTNLISKPWILNDFAPFPRTKAVRGVAGDLWADVIIGQPDFSQISDDQVVPFKLFNPGGVLVDRSVAPGRLYVWDAGNSRILGVDLRSCYAGPGPCVADIVIGQPSAFDHGACNADSNVQNFPFRAAASAETLCGIPDVAYSPDEEHSHVTMAVDAQGNLYVPDAMNNRVLKYIRPFETDTIADEVWGQEDFSGIVCNRDDPRSSPTRETLCFQSWELRTSIGGYASGVGIDPAGNLWVADAANHRVLRFSLNPNTGTIAKQADLVLGQPTFQSNTRGSGLQQFNFPAAVRTAANGWLYVADKGNDRVLVFKPPFTSGMRANSVFGSGFNRPTSLEMHVDNKSIWINDSESLTFELWEQSGNGVRKEEHQVSSRSGGGIGVDLDGNVLISITRFTQDVLRFPAAGPGTSGGVRGYSDRQLFSPPGGHNFKGGRELGWVAGVAVYGDQLIAADPKRLMFWNDVKNLRNGQTADGVIGETHLQQSPHLCCGRIKADGAGRLWVLGTETTRFIKVYQLPLTKHSVPIKTIQTESLILPVLGTNETVRLGPTTFTIPASSHRQSSTVTLGPYIRSIAPVGKGEMIWISDYYNHRVLRIRDPLTNPVVDVILGQTKAAGNKCNRQTYIGAWDNPEDHTRPPTADMLCFPGGLALDRIGNLYVSDHSLEVAGNKRLLVIAVDSIPFDNHTVIYAPAASKVFSGLGTVEGRYYAQRWEPQQVVDVSRTRFDEALATWEPAFDSANRMVVGFNSWIGPRFVGFYDTPLGPDTAPSGYFHDFGSMPYSVTFDENDNLYVTDINRNRILIYWNPFNNPQ